MKDLMIDLETLGTNKKAPIISIGAQYFDVDTGKLGDTFYAVLDIADQIDTGKRLPEASTIKWWMSQKEDAKTVFKEKSFPTEHVLSTFSEWILKVSKASKGAKATRKVNVWGNGSSFDITLMETLFQDFGVACPWMYYNVQDVRTFKRFVAKGEKIEVAGVKHNALADATAQAEYVVKHLKKDK